MKFSNAVAAFIFANAVFTFTDIADGHGFAGARFFPATLATDDPFVNDELSLPTISTVEMPEARETEMMVEIAMRLVLQIRDRRDIACDCGLGQRVFFICPRCSKSSASSSRFSLSD